MKKPRNVLLAWVLAIAIFVSSQQPLTVLAMATNTPDSHSSVQMEEVELAEDNSLPEGETQDPEGETQDPEGETQDPESEAQDPEGETQVPEGETQVPEGETQVPEGETQVPEGETQVPEGETQVPEGETQDPEGETQVPEGETQVPEELNPAAAAPMSNATGDKTSVIHEANPTFHLKITQNNSEVPEGGTLNGRSNFTIELTDIWAPTLGDRTASDGSDIIVKGDTITFGKADYFPDVNLTATGSKDIKVGNLKIATATFSPDAITILFNGDDTFFNGARKDVKFSLSTTAKAEDQTPGTAITTNIFGHSYKLENAPLKPKYQIALTCNSPSGHYGWISGSAFAEGAIEWKAVVTAVDESDPSIQMPLDGMVFSSPLANTGTYVENSFKISKIKVVDGKDQPSIPVDGAVPDTSDLTYTFPDGFGDYKAEITFKTWIPKEKYYTEYHGTNGGPVSPNTSAHQSVTISAELLNADNSKEAEVKNVGAALTPDWIQQYGKVSKVGDDTFITWTIDVNKRNFHRGENPRSDLLDMNIEDVLPQGTEFVSATYTINGASKGSISPTGNVFRIGDADGPVQLVIQSKVTDSSKTSFTNKPKATWKLKSESSHNQENDSGVTAETTVTVGAHAFSKSGVWVQDAAAAKWTISLTLQYDLSDPTVYDLLVYGGSRDVLDNLDANDKVSQEALHAIKANIDDKQLWQKYRGGTLTTTGATGEVITLTAGGVPVADLIKVTGFKGETAGTVSFESGTTNPDQLFRQDREGGWSNRALLFDADEYVNKADASNGAKVRMLNKEMLYAAEPLDANGNKVKVRNWNVSNFNYPVINNPNWYLDVDSDDSLIRYGYDQSTRTVTFRLVVNQARYNTDKIAADGGSRVASEIKLVDTLPVGWEFVEYAPGKDYELHAGYKYADNNDGGKYRYVWADPAIERGNAKHVVSSFTANGNVGTFTFSKLEGSYVILVKARPTNAALATYNLGDNRVENTAEFSMKWGDTLKSATETLPVIVTMQSLGKMVKKPVPGVQEWTVNYTPIYQMKQGVYLQDTLDAGLQLRKELDGSLSLAPSDLAVYKGKLKADGTLERVGAPLNLRDPNCEVKVSVEWGSSTTPTKLTFHMDDPNQPYQLVYQTESKGMMAGTKAGNQIKLLGDDTLPEISAQSSITLDSNDVSGNAGENGILYLKKVDPDGKPLGGVEFELFNPDGTPAKNTDGSPIGKKTSGSDGKANFIIQTPGLYLLKQTYIDETTWLPTTTEYWVRVIDAPGCPVLVDGVKVDANNPHVVPTPEAGKLTVKNTVAGSGGDQSKEFEFTVTFSGEGSDDTYTYKKPDGTQGTIKSGDKVILKHGESVVIPNLPVGLEYKVTQQDYASDDYTTDPTNLTKTGTIAAKGDHKAEFVNTRRQPGTLTVSNTVMGNGADTNKEFIFTVTFDGYGKDRTYSYQKPDGSTGTIKSGDQIRLKHGEKAVIQDLPVGLVYTVTENNYESEEYVTDPLTRVNTGTVVENGKHEANFVNTRTLYGRLLIGNTVEGNGAEPEKEFVFTVSFSGEGSDGTYTYEKPDGTTGTIKSGETINLKHGEIALIEGLPAGLSYTVTENDYAADGYTTDPQNRIHTGTIPVKATAEARYVNTRQLPVLYGVLRDNKTGKIIPNAKIIVENTVTKEKTELTTNEKGEYSLIVEANDKYTVTYTKMIQVGGTKVPVPFVQNATVNAGVEGGDEVPADITAVGIVLFKQPNGASSLLKDDFAQKTNIYLKDQSGEYIKDSQGNPKAFPLGEKGTFSAEGLAEGSYHMEIRYEVELGKELVMVHTKIDVKADGELNISEELIDPYGTITDKATKKAIENAEVVLYYADTQRNRDAGRVPGSEVILPEIPGFEPNNNKSPSQLSDSMGKYAYMVYPHADYYLVITKPGYVTYTSDTISVDEDIVRYDVEMSKIGSPGGDDDGSSSPGGDDDGSSSPGGNGGESSSSRRRGSDSDSSSSGDSNWPATHKLTIRGSSASGKRTYVVTFDKAGSFHYFGSKSGRIRSGDTIALGPDDYITIQGLPEGTAYQLTEKNANSDWKAAGSMNQDLQEFLGTGTAKNGLYNPNTGNELTSDFAALATAGFSLLLAVLVGLDLRLRRRSNQEN